MEPHHAPPPNEEATHHLLHEQNNASHDIDVIISEGDSDDDQYDENVSWVDPQEESMIRKIAINISEYVQEFRSKHVVIPSSSPCTIHRVPHNWRKVHETAFNPCFVSIGPFHYGDPYDYNFSESDKLKWEFLSDLLADFKCSTKRLAFEMKRLETEVRSRYSETFDCIQSDEFVLMMIRDASFLIQLFRRYANTYKVAVNDPIFSSRWWVPNLRRDVLMIENQLPWIVLEKLFEILGLEREGHPLTYLALDFCNPLLPRRWKLLLRQMKSDHYRKPDHLLGLFRASFLSQFEIQEQQVLQPGPVLLQFLPPHLRHQRRQKDIHEPQFIHCVAELQEAGVKFEARSVDYDLFDIAFKNGILTIPPLFIDNNTTPAFLNFLALEQCNISLKPYFTRYVSFIDNLVNTAKDVEILHYKGIINHSLGSDEEVAELFNKLCKEIDYEADSTDYLRDVRWAIYKHCDTRWNKWKAELKHIYFRSPWTIFSIIVAIFLLILTTLQTTFTIMPFYRKID